MFVRLSELSLAELALHNLGTITFINKTLPAFFCVPNSVVWRVSLKKEVKHSQNFNYF